jgi:hypothetical protein
VAILLRSRSAPSEPCCPNGWVNTFGICLFSSGPAKADPADEVKAAFSAWDAAFNDADAKAVAAFYTDDAIFLPAIHDVIKGPAGVEKFFGGVSGMGVTPWSFDFAVPSRRATVRRLARASAIRWTVMAFLGGRSSI